MGLVSLGYFLALTRGPFYGLLSYALVYFIPAQVSINWWVVNLPFRRWSLLSSFILIVSFLLHRDKLIKRKFLSVIWLFLFLILTLVITLTIAVDQDVAFQYFHKLLTYSITIFFITRAIVSREQFRAFLLAIVVLTGTLGWKAFTSGKRINARLENVGTGDTFGSNEFGLLLGSVIPFVIPFLIRGKWYEKLICALVLPFLLNAMILTNSRGAFLAFGVSIAYTFIFIMDAKIRKMALVAMFFAIPAFLYLTDAQFVERFSDLWHGATQKSSTYTEEDVSMGQLSSGRLEIWKYGLLMARDHPLGAGPNGFKELAHLYMPDEMLNYKKGSKYGKGIRAAHNSYLQVLVEQGSIGLLIWLALCFHTLYLLKKGTNEMIKAEKSNSFMGLTFIAFNISFMCILVGGMFGNRVFYEFFWWQVALSTVLFSLLHENQDEINYNKNCNQIEHEN